MLSIKYPVYYKRAGYFFTKEGTVVVFEFLYGPLYTRLGIQKCFLGGLLGK